MTRPAPNPKRNICRASHCLRAGSIGSEPHNNMISGFVAHIPTENIVAMFDAVRESRNTFRRRNLNKGFSAWWLLVLLVAIWGAAALVIGWSRSVRPTAKSVSALLGKSDFSNADAGGRAGVIERAAAQLNRLNYEERKLVRESGADREFFERLTADERGRFLDLTFPEGFKETLNALNKMSPEKRKEILERVLADIRKGVPEGDAKLMDEHARKLLSVGLDTFYKESSAEVKLEFAPVIEELQRASQSFR